MPMTGQERREGILSNIQKSQSPVPAKQLASMYDVSRQVIVQDIALMRASGYDILSTNRGYILKEPIAVSRVFKVFHTDEDLEEELCAIVDNGGSVDNVMVNHRVYGHMEAELSIRNRRDVSNFLGDIRSGKSSPLKNITSNYHYHTVSADREETLDYIEEELKRKGFLVQS